jgi:hypothetical protein
MPDVFASSPGNVLEFKPDGPAMPFQVRVPGFGGFQTHKGIITSVGIQQGGNYQFLHTLRNFVYVYVFGERIAELVISGAMYLNPCEGADPAGGFEKLYEFYEKNRISRNPEPLKIAIGIGAGMISLKSFLVGVGLQATDPSSMIGSFSFKLNYLPEQDLK